MTLWQRKRIVVEAIVCITKALNHHNVRFLKILEKIVGSSISLTVHIGHSEASEVTTFAILICHIKKIIQIVFSDFRHCHGTNSFSLSVGRRVMGHQHLIWSSHSSCVPRLATVIGAIWDAGGFNTWTYWVLVEIWTWEQVSKRIVTCTDI